MANGAIKGITVEIGGDTTKLGKALGETEKKSRSLQVELRQIDKLLKFDPTNTDLLAQRQDVLKSAIAETSSKLDTLREAEKQVIAQFERGEVAEEQVRALQREIVQTEHELEGMRSELSSTETAMKKLADGTDSAEKHTEEYRESVEKAKKELSDFKEKASETFDTLKTGATVIGGAVVAVSGYALKSSTDFDKAFNTLVTKTGASADEMEELNEAMERVYANNFGESIEDVAESMATVKTQTGLVGEELQAATENALLMRDTFDMDVNESIRAVNSLMDQFGITADEAYNLIAQGAQNGLNQNDDLLDTINEYSVQFQNAGYSAEDMFNMLANGVEAGTWSVDKLGDAVKEFNIRMSDGSAKEAVEALGFSWESVSAKWSEGGDAAKDVFNMLVEELSGLENSTEGYNIGVGLLGTMFEDLGYDAVRALSDTQGEISKTSSALEDINNQKYDDIGSALEGLGRTIETDVVKPLGEELKPVVEKAIEYVQANGPQIKEILSNIVSAIGDFVGFIVNNADVILATIAGIGTGLLVWNVVSMITGVVNAIKAFKLANEGATIAQWALNVAMNANPIGIIIALIAGLVAAFVLLWNNCEGFRNFWIGLWENIKSVFSTVVAWFSTTIPKIGEFFVNLWNGIVNVFSSIGPWFNTHVLQPIVNVFTTIVSWFNTNIIAPISQFYNKWISPLINKIIEIVKKLVEMVGALFVGLWNLLNSKVIKPITNGFKKLWNSVSGYFKNLYNDVVNIWNTVSGWFKSKVISPITNAFKSLWSTVTGAAKNAWSSIKNVFGSVKSWFSNTFSSAWSAVKNVFSNWGSFFSGLWTKIKDTFSKIGTNIANAISGAVKSGINGVISGIESIINTGIDLINGAISLINKLPGVNVGKLSRLSLPRLAKGGIVDRPTVAEIGEDGREAIIPLEKNTGWLREVAKELNDHVTLRSPVSVEALLSKLDKIYERLDRLQVVLDSGELVGGILDPIDSALNDKYDKVARGW